jgi:hypothetical protein
MINILVNIAFRLLGITSEDLNIYRIKYLFGASTSGHEARKKRWNNALVRLYKDKDMLDYLFYMSESDKENVFRGKIRPDLAKGARLRTLHLVYAAHQAYDTKRRSKRKTHGERNVVQETMKQVTEVYKKIVDIK